MKSARLAFQSKLPRLRTQTSSPYAEIHDLMNPVREREYTRTHQVKHQRGAAQCLDRGDLEGITGEGHGSKRYCRQDAGPSIGPAGGLQLLLNMRLKHQAKQENE